MNQFLGSLYEKLGRKLPSSCPDAPTVACRVPLESAGNCIQVPSEGAPPFQIGYYEYELALIARIRIQTEHPSRRSRNAYS